MRIQDRINFEEIRDYTIDRLNDCKGYNPESTDLHFQFFNEDYYIIGTYNAKQWLVENVFEVIETIKEYENDNFGEVLTDFSNPEKVVNMYVYIVGEEILAESETLRNKWNETLADKDIDNIISELETL